MKIKTASSALHLMYCSNIHPGESWEDHFAAVRQHAPLVKQKASPDRPFALGLRLSFQAMCTLVRDTGALRSFLRNNDMYIVSLNGFPYGTFHGGRVKEKVYLPDWSAAERFEYTLGLAHILSRLLPEGEQGSISTVPSHYGKKSSTAAMENIRRAGQALADLEKKTGKHIMLALEPEPDCFLDSLESVAAFFRELSAPDDPLRRHIGVCLDCCHAAVEFESPLTWLERFAEERIAVPKIQISAALRAEIQRYSLNTFTPFNDGTYLHQTRIASHGTTARYADLTDALAEPYGGEWRVHFHVPLTWEGTPELHSTRDTMDEAFFRRVASLPGVHLETETYSYDIFPGGKPPVADSIAAEIGWTHAHLFPYEV